MRGKYVGISLCSFFFVWAATASLESPRKPPFLTNSTGTFERSLGFGERNVLHSESELDTARTSQSDAKFIRGQLETVATEGSIWLKEDPESSEVVQLLAVEPQNYAKSRGSLLKTMKNFVKEPELVKLLLVSTIFLVSFLFTDAILKLAYFIIMLWVALRALQLLE